MKQLFAAILRRGCSWQASVPLESEQEWDAHATSTSALEKEGFILLGRPLEALLLQKRTLLAA
jgi:hypothetical protein